MFFRSLLVTAALVAATTQNASAAACPSLCRCPSDVLAVCTNIGLSTPPPGYFPHITQLELNYNNIQEIGLYDLSGFPNLEWLYVQYNPITELDMNVFANHKALRNLYISRNNIDKITALDEGVELPGLITLYMENNAIQHLPNNFLDAFPHLSYLNLGSNPIVLPGDGPFLSSKTLEYLTLTRADATAMSSKTFSELPELSYLYLANANFSEVGDAFSYLPSLNTFVLSNSNVKALRSGAFSKEQDIWSIELSNSQIEIIETSAVEGALVGRLIFSNTPLACDCQYESLYWWSIARGVTIGADCANGAACQFTRRKSLV